MKKPKLTLPDGADRGTADYIISSFEELFGRPLDFEIKTDSSLLGGFVAEIDGCVFDSSVSSKLADIGRILVKN